MYDFLIFLVKKIKMKKYLWTYTICVTNRCKGPFNGVRPCYWVVVLIIQYFFVLNLIFSIISTDILHLIIIKMNEILHYT